MQVPYNHTETGSRWQVGQNAPEFPEQQGRPDRELQRCEQMAGVGQSHPQNWGTGQTIVSELCKEKAGGSRVLGRGVEELDKWSGQGQRHQATPSVALIQRPASKQKGSLSTGSCLSLLLSIILFILFFLFFNLFIEI